MKRNNVGSSAVAVIIIVLLIVALGCSYYFGFIKNGQEIDTLKEEINSLKMEATSKENLTTQEDVNIISNEKDETKETKKSDSGFFGRFQSEDGVYKFVFLPNGEMCYINENSATGYKVMPGTYYIEDNTIYYSTNRMMSWFGAGSQISIFRIVDNNTLEYGEEEYGSLRRYTRKQEKISGKYYSDDASITFEGDSFKAEYDFGIPESGTFTINDRMLELKYTSSDKENAKCLILDSDTIVLVTENNGETNYVAYMKV